MYLIRADGNAEIGAGHLMRCLTIADALNDRDKVWFICAQEASGELVRSRGYRAAVLKTKEGHDLDYRDLESELSLWRELPLWKELPDHDDHVILVDSYFVTDRYLNCLKDFGKVVLLDDMGQHAYPVDMVINYNAFAEAGKYQELYREKNSKCYVGSRYVPLRPEFLHTGYQVRERVTDLLITAGGGDRDNIAGQVIRKIYREKLNYHLITGRYNPHYQELQEWAKLHPGVYIYHDVTGMAELMKKCDLAVTAGGTTVYELAAMGIPLICFSFAENQEALAQYIGDRDIAGYAGAFHKNPEGVLNRIDEWCREMVGDYEKRNMCYEMQKKMVDGQGAERVAEIIKEAGGDIP